MATIAGTSLDDVLVTTGVLDAVSALAGNDIILIGDGGHVPGEKINGGSGFDRIWFDSSTPGETLLLGGLSQVEAVLIADAGGSSAGTASLNINASAISTALLLVGNDGDNTITGTKSHDVIDGNAGLDALFGGAGNDRMTIRLDEAALDSADGGVASEGNTLVLAGAAAGTVVADLSTADGADQLLSVDGVNEAQVQSDFSHLDASDLRGAGVRVTGSARANTIIGSEQDDAFLYAAASHLGSSDVLNGGLGNDTLLFTSTTAGETLTVRAKVAGVEAVVVADSGGDTSGTTALNVNAEATKAALEIVGNDGANRLTGTGFDDTLNGNGGVDRLEGGAGNDRFVYDAGADASALEKVNGGKGTEDFVVFTSTTASDTLILGAGAVGIEAVYISDIELDRTGTTALDVDASAMAAGVQFFGNDGANALAGGKGNDTFDGGQGTDTIVAGAGADVVVMDAAALDAADAGNATEGNTLRLTGAAAAQLAINLSALADQDQMTGDAPVQSDFTHVDAAELEGNGVAVTGSSRTNKVTGSAQDDVFVFDRASHLGTSDVIEGGGQDEDGGDTVRFASTVAGETLALTARVTGIEKVEVADAGGSTAGTTTLHVSAAKALNGLSIIGNEGRNTLTGSAHDDTLNGNGGADRMIGGAGNDTFEIDSLADYVSGESINGGSGEDRLLFSSGADGDVLVLRSAVSGVEKFELAEGGAGIGINGDALKYGATYLGNDGDNDIRGSDFADIIEGGLGANTINGGKGADRIVFNVAADAGSIDAGALSEKNTLALKAPQDSPFFYVVDLSQADQLLGAAVGSGFTHVDATDMKNEEGGVVVIGDASANRIMGSSGADIFRPGRGRDTVDGGAGDAPDSWIVTSQADYDGDFYTDGGSARNDYIIFESTVDGATLVLRNNVAGVDAASAGAGGVHLHLDARAMNQPFGLQGNLGNNKLWGSRNGESIFDVGGADTMRGGGGDDDYTILGEAAWLFGVPGPDDVIDDSGGVDEFYFADEGSSMTLVIGTNVTGVERFIISGADLSEGGPFRRDNTTTNNAGIDAHHIKRKILLAGNDGDNVLIATAFNDTIEGFGGSDTITAGAGTDVVTMDVSDDIVDAIDAGAVSESNVLVLKGEASGMLELRLDSGTDQLVSIGGGNEALVQTGFRHVDASGLQEFGAAVYGTSAANRITGSAFDDILEGGAGKDALLGGGGNDAIVLRNVSHQVSKEVADAGEGTDDAVWFARTGGTTTLKISPSAFRGVEVLALADDTGDTSGTDVLDINASLFKIGMKLVGNDGANRLIGTSKDDVLTGNGGADRLEGGGGNDTYLYEAPGEFAVGERITDSGGSADVLRFTSTTDGEVLVLDAMVSGLEIVQLSDKDGVASGTNTIGVDASAVGARLSVHGNEGANVITGGAGADTIVGNGGNDTIVAGGGADRIEMGIDTATLDSVDAGARSEGNTLVVSGQAAGPMVWDLSSDADQLVSIDGAGDGQTHVGVTHLELASVTFTDVNEVEGATVTGSAEVNRVSGTALDDTFIVLAQAHFGVGETIAGLAGNDRLIFASAGAGETLLLTTLVTDVESVLIGTAAGDTSGTTALNVNAAAIRNGLTIEGNDGDNVITGTAHDDVITANAGADTIVAGAGRDKVKIDVADEDAIQAGAIGEGNEWVLEGAAGSVLVFDLSSTTDQLLTGALVQTGFTHLDARAVTGNGIEVTGSAAANRITGTALHDVILAGLGADVITMDAATYDEIDAGALGEGNELVLIGAAPELLVFDLSSAGDQLSTGTDDQKGFMHLDASAMTGNAVDVAGSGAANRITGTALQDTIAAGAGADVITMDVTSSFDEIDAGAGNEGDTLRLVGEVADDLVIDLSVAGGGDQLLGVGAAAEAVVQSGFQHVDASGMLGGGVELTGSGANNTLVGTAGEDYIVGLAGSDTVDLGVDPLTGEADGVGDEAVYLGLRDGVGAAGAAASRDLILNFESGIDAFTLAGEFNGGAPSLDDIEDDDAFVFATNERANFRDEHEALFISADEARLSSDSKLYTGSFSAVLKSINREGVTAGVGDDGLIVVQAKTQTGVYYYQELAGTGVQAKELTLLGIIDAHAEADDFAFG